MLARGDHFEVYANAGPDSAPVLLAAFERMHAFFARQVGVVPEPKRLDWRRPPGPFPPP
jgi:hypothetical protein